MGVAAAAVFDTKATGTGVSDNNGGFFVTGASGTDYSQQNSPQYALTGLASSGSGNTVLSAAASTDMVGNGANAVSGTNVNPGIYQVISVVAGVSITFSTNAAGQSIASGVVASLVLNIGGRLLTVGKAQGALSMGNIVYLNGTFTVTVEIAISTSVGAGFVTYIGYSSTRTDLGQATIQTSTNSVDIINCSGATNLLFKNITLIVTAGTPGSCINARTSDGARFRLINCLINGGAFGIRGNRSGADFGIKGLSLELTEVKNAVSHGVVNTFVTFMDYSFLHDNGGAGFCQDQGSSWSYSYKTVFYKNATGGVIVGDSNNDAHVQNHSYYECVFSTNTGPGINGAGSGGPVIRAHNCIFDRNTTYGVDLGTAAGTSWSVFYNCAFYSNTTAQRRTNADAHAPINDITLTADPYVTVGTNFALNNTTGGGAACKAVGMLGVVSWGTGYGNVGVFDPAAPTAGMFYQQGTAGGFE